MKGSEGRCDLNTTWTRDATPGNGNEDAAVAVMIEVK